METVTDFVFLGSKVTAVTAAMKLKDSHSLEEKLSQIQIGVPTISRRPTQFWKGFEAVYWKAMVLPVVMYGCDSWTIKKAEL